MGEPEALFNVGIMYMNGTHFPRDMREGARYFKMAADKGYVRAQVNYARALHLGDGVNCDVNEPARYYKMAADNGDPIGQFKYGTFLMMGQGVPRNPQEGMRYVQMAAGQGNEDALAFIQACPFRL